MSTELSFRLGSSQRQWLTLRGNSNPYSATDGPLPRVVVPLEARLTERGIEMQFLRIAIDLKLGQTLVGQGEIGPYSHLNTEYRYLPAAVTCPRDALPYLINPTPPQGRITLTLALKGLIAYRHSYEPGSDLAYGLEAPGTWHMESIGDQSLQDLDVQVARSDWYEGVVEKLGLASYLVTPLYLPKGVTTWDATLRRMDEALRAIVQGNPAGVFAGCRAAVDALPGDKTDIFAAMPSGVKRDAINELTRSIGKYIHSGRHVVPNAGGEQAGEFPVDQRDAVFVYNMTKLLLSHIASLTLTPQI
jgi:hypothetical protein